MSDCILADYIWQEKMSCYQKVKFYKIFFLTCWSSLSWNLSTLWWLIIDEVNVRWTFSKLVQVSRQRLYCAAFFGFFYTKFILKKETSSALVEITNYSIKCKNPLKSWDACSIGRHGGEKKGVSMIHQREKTPAVWIITEPLNYFNTRANQNSEIFAYQIQNKL